MNRVIVTIKNDVFWQEQDVIRISDDRDLVLFRVSVQTEISAEDHVVANALSFPISPEECEAVTHRLRVAGIEASISFHVADREGWAQAISGLDRGFEAFNVAAAIGVIKAKCGWDESPSMIVKINNTEVSVWPRFDGQAWSATDEAV